MRNHAEALERSGGGPETGTLDLVVIGAGIAGLNALNSALDYLPRGARVLLVDQKAAAGGMWTTAYDYVRLHQPHPMFTVGDMKWNWTRPRGYLAARDEVQAHLAGALDRIAERADLQALFGQTASLCREVETDRGALAEVTFHPNDRPGDTRTVLARRAIHAAGLDYRPADPLPLSSRRVISIIPQDLRVTLAAHPGADVHVVGGGKTGMDTILATLAQDPARRVTLINGTGSSFVNRTRIMPEGLARWTSGRLISRMFRDLSMQFDGDNEDHTLAHVRATYATDPDTPNGVFLYGLQSEGEQARIAAGLAETLPDYLQDVEDADGGPRLILRGGGTRPVAPGCIFVNCTGSFFRTPDPMPDRPILSPQGAVLSVTPRRAFHFLSSVAGFFLPHLVARDALRGRGFYALDHEALFRLNRNAWVGAAAAQAYMNQALLLQTLPLTLLDRCGLDLDRWYPLPRRMLALMQMKAGAGADIARCRRVLDRVADRFGIACSPIT